MKHRIILLSLIAPLICQAQIHKKCGPKQYLNTRSYIQNESLNSLPLCAIVHIDIKGWGTATFINDSTLITAKHLADKRRIKTISLYRHIYRAGSVEDVNAELNKGDFHIQHVVENNCDPYSISDDISYITLTKSGIDKAKAIYSNCIDTATYHRLSLNASTSVTLTGYPVDLAGEGVNKSDILATKVTSFGELLFAKDCPMVGYKIFTCSGDSGAPLLVQKNDKYYIIAIHHGGPEEGTIFEPEERNSAALIR